MTTDSQSKTSLPSANLEKTSLSNIAPGAVSKLVGSSFLVQHSSEPVPSSQTTLNDVSATPMRFGLTEAQFAAWWNAIPADDRDSFRLHGGDETTARFVCALDYLFHSGAQAQSGAIVEAWAYAVGEDPNLRHIAIEAQRTWDSDAVQDLVYRINRRSMRVAKDRIVLKYTELLERLLETTKTAELITVDDGVKVAQAVEKFVSLVDKEERQDAEVRLRKAYLRAMELSKEGGDFKAPNEEQLEVFVKRLEKHFGKDKLLKLIS
jgi:hypothetical protein